MELRLYGVWLRVQGNPTAGLLRFRVLGEVFGIEGLGSRAEGPGLEVWGSEIRV